MTIKSFSTAAKSVEDNEVPLGEPTQIEIDDRTVTFLPPTTGQWAVTLAGQADTNDSSTQMASQINFFFSMLDDDDATHIKRRLFDREDAFDVDTIAEILEYLFEEWSARPTRSPSASSPSQQNGGRKSTAVRHRSTP